MRTPMEPTTSPDSASVTAKVAASPRVHPSFDWPTYQRACSSSYGCGIWSSQRAISSSRHAAVIAGTSSSRHGRSVTTPSESGGSGGGTRPPGVGDGGDDLVGQAREPAQELGALVL